MHMITRGTGRIGKVVTMDWKIGHPFLFTVITSEYYTNKSTGLKGEHTLTTLCKLWPKDQEAYENLSNRLYVGNLIEIEGKYDNGMYQDRQGNIHYSPFLSVNRFQIHTQLNPVLKARYAEETDTTKKSTGSATKKTQARERDAHSMGEMNTPIWAGFDADDDLPF